MRKRAVLAILAALLCLFVLAGCQLSPCNCGCLCSDTHKEQRFPVGDVQGISVTTYDEAVLIYPSDGKEVVVYFSAMQSLATLEDGQLCIDTSEHSSRTDISIYLPRSTYSTVTIDTVKGAIEIDHLQTAQEIYARSEMGDIFLQRTSGLLDAATGSQEMTIGPDQAFIPEPVEGGGYRVQEQIGDAQTRIELYTEDGWMGLF